MIRAHIARNAKLLATFIDAARALAPATMLGCLAAATASWTLGACKREAPPRQGLAPPFGGGRSATASAILDEPRILAMLRVHAAREAPGLNEFRSGSKSRVEPEALPPLLADGCLRLLELDVAESTLDASIHPVAAFAAEGSAVPGSAVLRLELAGPSGVVAANGWNLCLRKGEVAILRGKSPGFLVLSSVPFADAGTPQSRKP